MNGAVAIPLGSILVWVLPAMVCVAGISSAWWVWESFWDRRLFAPKAATWAVNLSARQARELLEANPDLQVLDVRMPQETAQGTLPGARQVPWGGASFRQSLEAWDRSRPVLVYCAGGYRSRKAVRVLRDLGFRSVHHLHRGMMAWRWAGYPLEGGGPGVRPSR